MRHPYAVQYGADAGNGVGRATDGRIPAAGAGRRSGQVERRFPNAGLAVPAGMVMRLLDSQGIADRRG